VRESKTNGRGQRGISLSQSRSRGKYLETHPEPPVVVPPAAIAASAC
jgi:hypothetical protein